MHINLHFSLSFPYIGALYEFVFLLHQVFSSGIFITFFLSPYSVHFFLFPSLLSLPVLSFS